MIISLRALFHLCFLSKHGKDRAGQIETKSFLTFYALEEDIKFFGIFFNSNYFSVIQEIIIRTSHVFILYLSCFEVWISVRYIVFPEMTLHLPWATGKRNSRPLVCKCIRKLYPQHFKNVLEKMTWFSSSCACYLIHSADQCQIYCKVMYKMEIQYQ
jgi:hypothetical protein